MKLYSTLFNLLFSCLFIASYAQVSAEEEVQAKENLNNSIQQPIQEFFLSEAVYPQEKFEAQLTPSIYYWTYHDFELTDFTCLFEFGITDHFMIEAEIPYSLYNNVTISEPADANENENDLEEKHKGLGDVEVGLMYNLLLQKKLSLSFAIGVGLPVGDEERGLTEGVIEWEPNLTVARQFGKAQVHLNLGAGLSNTETEWNCNVATLYNFGQVSTTLELNGKRVEEHQLYITPGLVWARGDFFQLGIGAPIGLVGETAKWGMILRLNFEIGFLEDDNE